MTDFLFLKPTFSKAGRRLILTGREMAAEPVSGPGHHPIQGPQFLKQMGGLRDDRQLLLAFQLGISLTIVLQHFRRLGLGTGVLPSTRLP